MTKIRPYWSPQHDMKDFRFSIRKQKRDEFLDVSDVPESIRPFFCFAYLLKGEVMLEVEGKPWLCQANQVLLIPRNIPMKILYFKENTSFECGFSIHVVKDLSYPCLHNPHITARVWS